MSLRRATAADASGIGQLFYDTISRVNCADYSPAQVEAWRGGWQNLAGWQTKIVAQYFLVAEDEAANKLSGFASLAPDGYLDFLFVSAAYQRQGVARSLLARLLQQAASLRLPQLYTDASITARPFFARHDFLVEREQQLLVRGVELSNYRMIRYLSLR